MNKKITIFIFLLLLVLSYCATIEEEVNMTNEIKDEPVFIPEARAAQGMAYVGNNRVIMFGGVSYKSKYTYLADTLEYDVSTGKWKEIEISEEEKKPSERMALEMVYIGDNKIILYGGASGNYRSPKPFNDMWEFNTVDNKWKEIEMKGDLPPDRTRQRMVYVENNKIIMFGGDAGKDDKGKGLCHDDTWEYNIITNEWKQINTGENTPPARETHAMVYVGNNKIIMFGGQGYAESGAPIYYNDTWVYDVENASWKEINVGEVKPSERMYLAMTYIENGKIILFGGWNGSSAFNDTWVYDVENASWKEIDIDKKPLQRDTQRMVYVGNDKLIMFGGWGQSTLKDTWEYDIINKKWEKK